MACQLLPRSEQANPTAGFTTAKRIGCRKARQVDFSKRQSRNPIKRLGRSIQDPGQIQIMFTGALGGDFIAGIGVSHDP